MHDKPFWKAIAAANYELPADCTTAALTPELEGYLGSPDPELRDGIAYETLGTWIISSKIPPDELRILRTRWIANLQRGLGEHNTDSVLLRSFSALVLSVLAYRDWKEPFLTDDERTDLLHAALAYLAAERDERGYEETRGWLHSVAHTADLLKFLARHPLTESAAHQRILAAIADKITRPRTLIFVYGEPDRLCLAVLDVLKRGTLPDAVLTDWVEQFKRVKAAGAGTQDPTYQNTKHFLRALYIHLAVQQPPIETAGDLPHRVLEAAKLYLA